MPPFSNLLMFQLGQAFFPQIINLLLCRSSSSILNQLVRQSKRALLLPGVVLFTKQFDLLKPLQDYLRVQFLPLLT